MIKIGINIDIGGHAQQHPQAVIINTIIFTSLILLLFIYRLLQGKGKYTTNPYNKIESIIVHPDNNTRSHPSPRGIPTNPVVILQNRSNPPPRGNPTNPVVILQIRSIPPTRGIPTSPVVTLQTRSIPPTRGISTNSVMSLQTQSNPPTRRIPKINLSLKLIPLLYILFCSSVSSLNVTHTKSHTQLGKRHMNPIIKNQFFPFPPSLNSHQILTGNDQFNDHSSSSMLGNMDLSSEASETQNTELVIILSVKSWYAISEYAFSGWKCTMKLLFDRARLINLLLLISTYFFSAFDLELYRTGTSLLLYLARAALICTISVLSFILPETLKVRTPLTIKIIAHLLLRRFGIKHQILGLSGSRIRINLLTGIYKIQLLNRDRVKIIHIDRPQNRAKGRKFIGKITGSINCPEIVNFFIGYASRIKWYHLLFFFLVNPVSATPTDNITTTLSNITATAAVGLTSAMTRIFYNSREIDEAATEDETHEITIEHENIQSAIAHKLSIQTRLEKQHSPDFLCLSETSDKKRGAGKDKTALSEFVKYNCKEMEYISTIAVVHKRKTEALQYY